MHREVWLGPPSTRHSLHTWLLPSFFVEESAAEHLAAPLLCRAVKPVFWEVEWPVPWLCNSSLRCFFAEWNNNHLISSNLILVTTPLKAVVVWIFWRSSHRSYTIFIPLYCRLSWGLLSNSGKGYTLLVPDVGLHGESIWSLTMPRQWKLSIWGHYYTRVIGIEFILDIGGRWMPIVLWKQLQVH